MTKYTPKAVGLVLNYSNFIKFRVFSWTFITYKIIVLSPVFLQHPSPVPDFDELLQSLYNMCPQPILPPPDPTEIYKTRTVQERGIPISGHGSLDGESHGNQYHHELTSWITHMKLKRRNLDRCVLYFGTSIVLYSDFTSWLTVKGLLSPPSRYRYDINQLVITIQWSVLNNFPQDTTTLATI